MGLEFKDIGDWTPSTVSIVDEPYHPLAYFEVYENDDEFVKKFKETKVNNMPNENSEKNVTMSESFFEKLFGGLVAKRDPTPTQQQNQTPSNETTNNNEDSVSNKEILEAIQKLDGRVTAIEEGSTESNNAGETGETGETKTEGNNAGGESGDGNTEGENPVQTVELPLNEDGTLNMDDAVVAKYIPRGSSFSQSVDGDLTRGAAPDKSLNERTGRSENGMNW